MAKIYLKPLWTVLAFVIVGVFSFVSNMVTVFNFNLATYNRSHAPWSYLVFCLIVVIIYLMLVVLRLHLYISESKPNVFDDKTSIEPLDRERDYNTKVSELERRVKTEDMLRATDTIIECVERAHRLFQKTNENGGQAKHVHDQEYKSLKRLYLNDIDVIEEEFANFIVEKEYNIGGSVYENPGKWDTKPLNAVFGQANLQSAYARMLSSRTLITPAQTERAMEHKFDRISSLLTRFKNDLNSRVK